MYRHYKARKKFYTELAKLLVLISTFAGTVTLNTQYILQDCKRPQALLVLASQLFLASPPALFAIYGALSNFNNHSEVHGQLKLFIIVQFGLVTIMIIGGFICINVSILYFGAKWTGPAGLALTGTVFLTVIAAGWANREFPNQRRALPSETHLGITALPDYKDCSECGTCSHGIPDFPLYNTHNWNNKPNNNNFTRATIYLSVAVCLEGLALVAVFIMGIIQVVKANGKCCNGL